MQLLPVFRCPDCIADLNLHARDCRDLGLLLFCSWRDTSVAPLAIAKKKPNRSARLSIAPRARP